MGFVTLGGQGGILVSECYLCLFDRRLPVLCSKTTPCVDVSKGSCACRWYQYDTQANVVLISFSDKYSK